MADGEVVGRSEVLNSLLDQSSRLGALEKLVEERPSFQQLMNSNNELRRELGAKIDKTAEAQAKADEARDRQREAQIENLKLVLGAQQASVVDQAVRKAVEASRVLDSAMIDQAVNKALEAERSRENKAREAVDNKAKDAVRGVRMMVTSQSWMIVILILAIAALVANNIWKFF